MMVCAYERRGEMTAAEITWARQDGSVERREIIYRREDVEDLRPVFDVLLEQPAIAEVIIAAGWLERLLGGASGSDPRERLARDGVGSGGGE
ncbi:MAG TPA: hypothetical protein VJU87_10775 [Gemmatimonadaceae bacterium]|nr:hypothetical protein [Gemmatimonadaceae bacterium]